MRRASALAAVLLLASCAGEVPARFDASTGGTADASGAIDARTPDAPGVPDARATPDAPVVPDARAPIDARVIPDGPPPPDSPAPPDAPPPIDAQITFDAHPPADAPAMIDARPPDAMVSLPDAPPPDATVVFDARPPDAMPPPDASTTGGGTIGGCAVFPPGDPWNQDVSGADVDLAWTTKLHAHANKTNMHPDFGESFGLPINVVPQGQALVPINFDEDDESEPGPYPYPPSLRIEGGTPTNCGGDCHVLVVQQGACTLWEAAACEYSMPAGAWNCYTGAKFDLTEISVGQRPKGWTSADAAGLPITAGLVRRDEITAGHIDHAIRFTMHCTQDGFVSPASHYAVPGACGGIDTATLRAEYPPMGTRVRLNPDYPTAGMPTQSRIVAEAMKKYGMILADNGSDYYFQGDEDPGWDDEQLNALKDIPGDQLQVLTMPPIERGD